MAVAVPLAQSRTGADLLTQPIALPGVEPGHPLPCLSPDESDREEGHHEELDLPPI
jgi:hypothetical protein